MSTDRAPRRVQPGLEHHGLRLTLAVMAALLVGMGFSNPLIALVGPLFAAVMMAPGSPPPGAAKLIVAPVAIWLICATIATVAAFLAEQDAVLLFLMAATVFQCFRMDAVRGPSPITALLLILLVTVGPMSAAAASFAGDLVEAMSWSAFVAMLATAFAHAVMPVRHEAAARAGPAFVPDERLRGPLGKTAILMLLVGWFIVTGKSDALYILVTAATVLRMPRSTHIAAGLVASNFVGGSLAMILGGLAVVVSGDLFTAVVFAAMILVLGLVIEGGGTRGLIAQGAVSAAIILFAMTVMPADGAGAYVTRVLEIAATMIFVILGRTLVDVAALAPRLKTA